MINYNNNEILNWNFDNSNITKVYRNNAVVYQKLTTGGTPTPPSPSGLPSGYTEVEYISNYSGGTATPTSTTKNGLAYIDTNFIPTEKTRTVADLQITQASQNPRYFGSGKWNGLGYIVSQEWTVGESRARIYCKYGQSSGWIQTDYVPTMDRHVYDLNNDGKLLIDNVEISTLPTTSFTCSTSMAIFTATRANDTYVDLGETVFGRCYSFKIYEDGILVRDFVPCTRDSDSKAGMYDIVNDVFYSSGNDNNLYAGPTRQHDYSQNYITFVAETNNVSISLNNASSNTFYYSTDNGLTWNSLTNNQSTSSINSGEKILFKASGSSAATETGIGRLLPSSSASVEGNIMSLVYGDNFYNQTVIPNNYQLRKLFSGATNIISAENLVLPATTLTKQCYSQMFQACTSLTTAPISIGSSAMTWNGDYCFSDMFHGCSSLTTAPQLPSTTLATACYWCMFVDCTSLTTAPELPATTLANNCYRELFNGCTNLNYIKAMFTTTPSTSYTRDWVSGVASSGTFVKNRTATWSIVGNNGVPNGWTIETSS